MNVEKRGGRGEKRRIQFSLRTLLVSAMILGPLSGWYGPWIVTQLRDLMADDPKAQPAPLLVNPSATFKMRYRHTSPVRIDIERGMKADMLERVHRQEVEF
jgi:hypothetical protein